MNLSLKYILFTTLILLLAMGLTLAAVAKRHERLVMAQIEMQAKALFQQVVITRRWVADHGGVYVEKLPWVRPNPYLANPAIQAGGRRYIKENPAMVTKQLSRYAQKEGLYVFHITSLKLLNPENAPDEFEVRALREFETKAAKEASKVVRIGKLHYFRYMAPLYIEQACLDCHAKQGYKIGDVRGGISVSMPMDYALAVLRSDRRLMIAAGSAVAGALMLALFLITRYMVITPVNRMRTVMARFSKDGNPQVPLLKTGDEMEELSKSFADMANSIHDYQTHLQEKIKAATSELTANYESLAKSSRSKSDFIAKTSHELRTPLTAIKGAMDYLSARLSMRDSDEDRALFVFFELIKKNADRMIRLVNNILDYERIELGAFEMNFGEVNLKDAFREVVTGLTPLAKEKQVSILMKAADVTAFVDEDRLKQVLTNLLSNALNFSPPASTVRVSLACRGEQVQATVEDQGCGIPAGERGMIFKQFYTNNVKDGTGLGLAICKGIVEAHGGAIGVEGTEDGGSRFWFTISRSRKEQGAVEEKAACC